MSVIKKIKNDVFNVEKILRKRVVDGRTEYLLKWEGFSEKENTWEPKENIFSQEMLEDFEEKWAREERHRKHYLKSLMTSTQMKSSSSSSKENRHSSSSSNVSSPAQSTSLKFAPPVDNKVKIVGILFQFRRPMP